MPARMATAPPTCCRPAGLPNSTTPATAPTSGSMLRNAPATSARIRACPWANSVKASSVPPAVRPATASTGPTWCGTAGRPSVAAENGSTARAAPRNWTAVTAIGSRPRSRRVCATVKVAISSRDASTRPSPPAVAPPPRPPVIRPTPASETANPAQATGRATLCCQSAATMATRTGTAPMSRAAWLTLVRVMPAFCTTTDAPYPIAPEASTAGRKAARTPGRAATASSTAAATPNRANVSQPGGSHCRASFDSGTVVPHSSPAMVSAAIARRRSRFMPPIVPSLPHTISC